MPSDWGEVETLICDLGAIRAAAFTARASLAAYAAIEQAIDNATQAVVETLDDPRNVEAVGQARQAINNARELVASLAAETDRARRARERAAELGIERRRRDAEVE
jgi:hypothetical protein